MRRSRHFDFISAFLLALLIHGAVGYCAVNLFGIKGGLIEPVFRHGDSSVELTLLPALADKIEVQPEEPVMSPPVDELPPLEVVEASIEPMVPIEQEQNADMLEKGVREAPSATTPVRPQYPYGSRIRGEEGDVVLSATLDNAGCVAEVKVLSTSGYHALDRAAIKALKQAVFIFKNGSPVIGQNVEYTFHFKLNE